MKIYYWPDGCWCEESELSGMTHKSDDFGVIVTADDTDYTEIDELVQELVG
jgi:hypothetical protein